MRRLLLLGLAIGICGCTGPSDLRELPLDTGETRSFRGAPEPALDAARDVLGSAGLEVREVYRPDDGVRALIAESSGSWFSWGEVVRVLVDARSSAEGEVTVRVVTRRKFAPNLLAQGDYSDDVFAELERRAR